MFYDEHILSPSKFYVTMTSSNELYVSNACENLYQNCEKKILWSWLPNPFNNNKVIQTELVDGLTR